MERIDWRIALPSGRQQLARPDVDFKTLCVTAMRSTRPVTRTRRGAGVTAMRSLAARTTSQSNRPRRLSGVSGISRASTPRSKSLRYLRQQLWNAPMRPAGVQEAHAHRVQQGPMDVLQDGSNELWFWPRTKSGRGLEPEGTFVPNSQCQPPSPSLACTFSFDLDPPVSDDGDGRVFRVPCRHQESLAVAGHVVRSDEGDSGVRRGGIVRRVMDMTRAAW